MTESTQKAWWKEAIVYQIYPRSFNDSNGDGIGDLRGIIEKLDYLKSLGIDLIWLCPMYDSPNDDNGYDIRNYYEVMSEFGTMADFDELLAELKKRDLKVILDLVVNHCSDEHEWFVEAKKSKDNPYRDYFYWEPPVDGKEPNDWVSFFSGSVWDLDESTKEYYLHLFSKKQPDLNWENPKLREEVYQLMRFWLDKGIDGFRMDVIPFISKELPFKNYPADYTGDYPRHYANGPRVHEFLREMHREVLSKYDIMTVGEGPGISTEEGNDYVGHDRNELNMIFHFGHMFLDRATGEFLGFKKWSLVEFKAVFADWDAALGNRGWNSIFLGNHDFPRIVSRFGNDQEYRLESGKLLATLLCTMRGTTYIYQGDEIGMTNVAYPSIEDYNDIATRNAYRELEETGGDVEAFMKLLPLVSRDNARTPVQWDDSENAGFTTGTPWLKVNPNYPTINVSKALKDENSIFYFYQKMIQFRKDHPILTYGTYEDLAPEHDEVFIYKRSFEGKEMLVTLNFSTQENTFDFTVNLAQKERIWKIGNYEKQVSGKGRLVLKAYEACVFEV